MPSAPVSPRAPKGTAALVTWLLDLGGRAGASRMRAPQASHAAEAGESHRAHAHGQLCAAVFAEDAPLLAEPLLQMCERLGPALVRAKGFVHLAGEARRGFLERAGAHTTLRYAEPWGDEHPRTELVMIGEGFDEAAIRRQIWACRAPQN